MLAQTLVCLLPPYAAIGTAVPSCARAALSTSGARNKAEVPQLLLAIPTGVAVGESAHREGLCRVSSASGALPCCVDSVLLRKLCSASHCSLMCKYVGSSPLQLLTQCSQHLFAHFDWGPCLTTSAPSHPNRNHCRICTRALWKTRRCACGSCWRNRHWRCDWLDLRRRRRLWQLLAKTRHWRCDWWTHRDRTLWPLAIRSQVRVRRRP
jgi:hypothetical protein